MAQNAVFLEPQVQDIIETRKSVISARVVQTSRRLRENSGAASDRRVTGVRMLYAGVTTVNGPSMSTKQDSSSSSRVSRFQPLAAETKTLG